MGYYSPRMAPFYPWFFILIVLSAKQVSFFESLVWLDLGLNPGLPDHWWKLYSFGNGTKLNHPKTSKKQEQGKTKNSYKNAKKQKKKKKKKKKKQIPPPQKKGTQPPRRAKYIKTTPNKTKTIWLSQLGLHNTPTESLQRSKTSPMSVPDMTLDKSDGKAPGKLEIWGMRSTP